eukprot:3244363-Pleurochrysis_carterae.AAC.1
MVSLHPARRTTSLASGSVFNIKNTSHKCSIGVRCISNTSRGRAAPSANASSKTSGGSGCSASAVRPVYPVYPGCSL